MRILLKSIPGGLEVVDGNLCKPCSIGESVASEVRAQYEQELAKYTKADCSALIVLTTNMTEGFKKCHEVLHSQGGMAGVEEIV
jgi:hypothetical protein